MKNILIAIGIFLLAFLSAFLGLGASIFLSEGETGPAIFCIILLIINFSASIFLSLKLYKKDNVNIVFLCISAILLFLFAAFFSIVFAAGIATNTIDMTTFGVVSAVSFLVPSFILIAKESKLEKIRKQAKLAKKDKLAQEQGFLNHQEKTFRSVTYTLTHVLGLPVMQGAVCKVISERDKLTIEAQKTVYNLSKDRITSISRETNIQKYSQAVSSIGGAVVGGMLFGGIGAAIGGRATSKDFQAEHQYLVITYIGDDETVKYVIFDYTYKSQSLIRDFELFNKTNLQKRNVEIK